MYTYLSTVGRTIGEEIWTLSIFYGIIGIPITVGAMMNPIFGAILHVYEILGFSIVLWELFASEIKSTFYQRYDSFSTSDLSEKRWELVEPKRYRETEESFAKFHKIESEGDYLELITVKANYDFEPPPDWEGPYPPLWEGPEILAKKTGYNSLSSRLSLDPTTTNVEDGNIYLSGRGQTGRFEYLFGIDWGQQEVFFHIWDNENEQEYGQNGHGYYVEERGRTQFKDFFENDDEMLSIGIEWGINGPKYFAKRSEDERAQRIPVVIPPNVREELLKDSRRIWLFGLDEFAVRTDLVVDKGHRGSLGAYIDHVDVKSAPLSIIS